MNKGWTRVAGMLSKVDKGELCTPEYERSDCVETGDGDKLRAL